MTDASRPRPRPVPEPETREPDSSAVEPDSAVVEPGYPTVAGAARPRPVLATEATVQADVATEPDVTPPADPGETAAAAEAEPTAPRPTRSARRAEAAAALASSTSSTRTRIGRSVAALCVLAGVAGFVVVRHQDGSVVAGRDGGSPSSSASSATDDPAAAIVDSDLASAFVSSASTGVVTVTESDYRRLDDALSAGLAVTTGTFRTRFRSALTGDAAAARVSNHSTTSVSVLQSGIGTISDSGRAAKVLIFARVTQAGDNVGIGERSVLTTLCVSMVRDGNQYLISDLVQGANAGLPAGTSGLRAAAEAARQEVIDALTYTRSNFAADLAKAESGATGAALKAISGSAGALKTRLTKGSYDLSGAVTAVAVQSASADSVTMLLAATGTRLADSGASDVDSDGHYLVTVQRAGGAWRVSSITTVS